MQSELITVDSPYQAARGVPVYQGETELAQQRGSSGGKDKRGN